MATKFDRASPVETGHVHSVVSTSSSTVPSTNSKVSKFGTKAGFVIPKNKLAGSLVLRGSGKVEVSDTVKDDSKNVQRKTKWGVDLTQDASVRRGRILAYQTRVDQIIKQVESKFLHVGDEKDSQSPKQVSDDEFVSHGIDNEASNLHLLDLEKREIIGEILRLNPNFKPPSDYKPLLKEAKVPITFKKHSGYNLIGLLGSENNTQKRLEEETGAKIRVYGIKEDKAEKREIIQSDSSEVLSAFTEINVSVSADTYEKIDVAVALIELLITPVAGSADMAIPTSTSSQDVSVSTSMNTSATMTAESAQNSPSLQPQIQACGTPLFSSVTHSGFAVAPQHSIVASPFSTPPYFGQPPLGLGLFPRTFSPLIARPQVSIPPPNITSLANQHMSSIQQTGLVPNQQPPPNHFAPPPNQLSRSQQSLSGYPIQAMQPSSGAPLIRANQVLPPSSGLPLFLKPQTRPIAPHEPAPNIPSVMPVYPTNPLEISQSSQFAMPPQSRMNTTQLGPQSFLLTMRPFSGSPPSALSNIPSNAINRPPLSQAAFPSQPLGSSSFSSISQSGSLSHPPVLVPPFPRHSTSSIMTPPSATPSQSTLLSFPIAPLAPPQPAPNQATAMALVPPALLPPQAHQSSNNFTFQLLRASVSVHNPAMPSSGQSVSHSPSNPGASQLGPPYWTSSQTVGPQAPSQEFLRPTFPPQSPLSSTKQPPFSSSLSGQSPTRPPSIFSNRPYSTPVPIGAPPRHPTFAPQSPNLPWPTHLALNLQQVPQSQQLGGNQPGGPVAVVSPSSGVGPNQIYDPFSPNTASSGSKQ